MTDGLTEALGTTDGATEAEAVADGETLGEAESTGEGEIGSEIGPEITSWAKAAPPLLTKATAKTPKTNIKETVN